LKNVEHKLECLAEIEREADSKAILRGADREGMEDIRTAV